MPAVAYIGDRLKGMREAKVLTQHQLADRAGVSQAAIARIETNKTEPHFTTIQKLAAALGVEPADLVRDE